VAPRARGEVAPTLFSLMSSSILGSKGSAPICTVGARFTVGARAGSCSAAAAWRSAASTRSRIDEMARREQARDTLTHTGCQLASTGPGGLRPWDTDTEKKGGSVASRVAHDPCNLTIASYYSWALGLGT
jgi:hypothetical protein